MPITSAPASTWALRKTHSHFEDKIEKVAHKHRIVIEIEHERVDAAQIRRRAAGAFHPAFYNLVVAHALLQQSDGLDAIVHAPSAQGIGDLQLRQRFLIGKQCLRFDDGRRVVLKVFHDGPTIGRLASFGNGRDVVEIKFLRSADLRFRQHVVVGAVGKVLGADLVCREHHGNGHDRQAIHRPTIQHGENAIAAIHMAFPTA